MLKVVDSELAIRRYQRLFSRALRAQSEAAVPVLVGHPGASRRIRVLWSERLGIWFFHRKITSSRYWNAFGLGRPQPGGQLAITCEINFPLCGIDRRTGGAFARDEEGRVFVIHRGKLGGGRKGVGKSLFAGRYRGVWAQMEDGAACTPVAVIADLSSPRFGRQIAQFVRKIARIKEEAGARQGELSFDELLLHDELIGDPYGKKVPPEGFAGERDLIVQDLAEALRAGGFKAGNDGQRDLVVMDRRGVRAVLQIVTGTDPDGVLAGAAKLMLAGLDIYPPPLLVLALPAPPPGGLGEKLRRLSLFLLPYAWQGERAVFPGLPDLLRRLGPEAPSS